MPKSDYSHIVTALVNRGLPEVVTETAVYRDDGAHAFHRVGADVYSGAARVLHVVRDNVYDADGVLRFYISGLGWFSADGQPSYYQEREITDEAELREAERRAAEEAALQEVQENARRADVRKRARRRKGWFRTTFGGHHATSQRGRACRCPSCQQLQPAATAG